MSKVSNYPGGWSNGVLVRGLPIAHNHRKVLYVGNNPTTLVGERGAKDSNPGDYLRPVSTINYALSLAKNGDIVYVRPGYTETVDSADEWGNIVEGVTIIGMGDGEARPIITYDGTDGTPSIVVDVANVKIYNMVFKNNEASLNHMFDVKGDDLEVGYCDFREGTATGLSFITADTADGDSDRLWIHDCRFYAPTAGNYDNAIQLGKDHVGVRIERVDIYGDFDDAGIHVPAGGNACLDLAIRDSRVVNLLTNVAAISINGTSCTGEISNVRLGTDTLATSLDNGSLRTYNVTWASTTDQVSAVPVFAETDSANNVLGADNNNNAFASTNVAENEDGSVLERLEYIQEGVSKGTGTEVAANKSLVDAIGFDGSAAVAASAGMLSTMVGTYLVVKKTLTSSAILAAGVDVTGLSTVGDMSLVDLQVQADATGLAAGTAFTLETNNTKGSAVFFSTTVAGLGANALIDLDTAATTSKTVTLEMGKKIVAKCTGVDCTGSGTIDVYLIFRRHADNATLAAA